MFEVTAIMYFSHPFSSIITNRFYVIGTFLFSKFLIDLILIFSISDQNSEQSRLPGWALPCDAAERTPYSATFGIVRILC